MILGVIPARYASTRLAGKPLIDIGGKSMIQRVYEQCLKCDELNDVIVATDDQRIFDHVLYFGGKVMLTSTDHQSGTDRCAEVVGNTDKVYHAVINIQGDEPFINPDQISKVIRCFEDESVQIATLFKKISREQDAQFPNTVKVVMNNKNNALYFSRSVIPYRRNQGAEISYNKHIGLYGYRTETLLQITQLKPSMLEQAESLEQLRWLENGFTIRMCETQLETLSIDTPDDLKLVENYLKSS
jgi:3-deoxy-manno-octulosonate cytidylyltransferase (CMP-KDO synthetase)